MAKRIVFTKRLQLIGLLSVPSGMPLGWIFNTFQVFLVDLGISRTQIGFLSAASLPWTLKFLWAPLVDRFALPWPGRRRSWIILTQLGLALAFGALAAFAWRALAAREAGTPLASAPLVLGLLALGIALLGATQDIAYDAYAVEFLRAEEHAAAPGVRSVYYWVGMLLAGAVAIGLVDVLGWPLVFLLLGALFVACVGLVFWCDEPEQPPVPRASLREAVVEPLGAFFRRSDAIAIALFLIFYKFGDNMAGTMVNPFLKDLCFSNAELGAAVKTIGIVASIAGSAAAVGLTMKLGVGRALWVLGIAQALANLLYAAAAREPRRAARRPPLRRRPAAARRRHPRLGLRQHRRGVRRQVDGLGGPGGAAAAHLRQEERRHPVRAPLQPLRGGALDRRHPLRLAGRALRLPALLHALRHRGGGARLRLPAADRAVRAAGRDGGRRPPGPDAAAPSYSSGGDAARSTSTVARRSTTLTGQAW